MKKQSVFALVFVLAFALSACSGDASLPNDGYENSSAATPVTGSNRDGFVQNSGVNSSQVRVYNAGGYLVNTVRQEDDLNAFVTMLTTAPVYTGETLYLGTAPYRLEIQGSSIMSCDLWLRNDRVYFKRAETDTLYAPDNISASEFKRIINHR